MSLEICERCSGLGGECPECDGAGSVVFDAPSVTTTVVEVAAIPVSFHPRPFPLTIARVEAPAFAPERTLPPADLFERIAARAVVLRPNPCGGSYWSGHKWVQCAVEAPRGEARCARCKEDERRRKEIRGREVAQGIQQRKERRR